MHDADQEQVEAILAEAVDQLLAGRTPDIEALALAHPALAGEIRRRWQELQKLHDPLGPLLQTDAGSGVFAPGAWVGNFRLIREIGRGGMGVVYEAEQREPRRSVAVKIIRGGTYLDEHAVKMFQREAAALARLKHPAIAAVYEAGRTEDGRHFFAMELVQGVPLNEHIRRHELPLRDRLGLFGKVCEGVNYAHQRGVIHCDLKPGNILIDEHGLPRILDFGLARITDADVNVTTQATDTGRIQGTLLYMSPEQARGDAAEIDVRSDVYALGVILYELLTGRLPHDLSRASIPEAVRAICEDPPARPSSGARWDGRPARQFRGDLETVVLKALEKDPSRRYQNVAALADDVSRFLTNQPILARPPSAAYQLRKFVTRHKAGAAFAASLLCSLAALAIVMSVMSVKLAHERDQAEQARAAAIAAEQQATVERDRAKIEAGKAKQVQGFVENLLGSVNPKLSVGLDKRLICLMLRNASQSVDTELSGQAEVEAGVRSVIGNAYFNLGLYDEAQPHLERSLAIREASLGPDDPDTVFTLNNLAVLYLAQGRYGQAEAMFIRIATIAENAADSGRNQLVPALGNLAALFSSQGKYEQAEALFKKALEIQERLSPPTPTDLAAVLNNLAGLYISRGRHDEAEPLLQRALTVQENALGSDHPDLAPILNLLGVICSDRGRWSGGAPK